MSVGEMVAAGIGLSWIASPFLAVFIGKFIKYGREGS